MFSCRFSCQDCGIETDQVITIAEGDVCPECYSLQNTLKFDESIPRTFVDGNIQSNTVNIYIRLNSTIYNAQKKEYFSISHDEMELLKLHFKGFRASLGERTNFISYHHYLHRYFAKYKPELARHFPPVKTKRIARVYEKLIKDYGRF